MSNIPRLLPLVGVALVGVIAVNAMSGAHALPHLLSATQAAAEEALSPKGAKHAKPVAEPAEDAAADPKAQSSLPSGAAPQSASPPMCAPSPTELAKAAGLSPAELQVLQSLQTRRGQIDDREKDLDTEVQLLAAAEAKLDAKLKSMNTLKADIQALMGQADQKTQGEVDRLTIVYSKMKPADAAAVMAQLDDKVRLPIAASMKPAILSAILGKMGTLEAKDLTEKLAHRFAPVQALAQANAPAPEPSMPQKPAAAKPQPAKTAAAGDPDGAAGVDPADGAGAAPAKTPLRKLAKAAARHAPPRPRRILASARTGAADPVVIPSAPQPYTALRDKTPPAASGPAQAPAKSS